jgi:hypothetical protein
MIKTPRYPRNSCIPPLIMVTCEILARRQTSCTVTVFFILVDSPTLPIDPRSENIKDDGRAAERQNRISIYSAIQASKTLPGVSPSHHAVRWLASPSNRITHAPSFGTHDRGRPLYGGACGLSLAACRLSVFYSYPKLPVQTVDAKPDIVAAHPQFLHSHSHSLPRAPPFSGLETLQIF